MNKTKRILALFLVLALVLQNIPEIKVSGNDGLENHSVIYVDGTIAASGTGMSDADAFKTIEEAYAYIKSNSPVLGGTVVLGSWTNVTTGTRTLNLVGFNDGADILNEGFWDNFDTINITEKSKITYAYTLGAKPAITVESGSTLKLPANADDAGLSVTGNTDGYGTIIYGESSGEDEEKSLSVVYLDGTLETSGDGKTAATAVNDITEAYKLLDAEVGGTIVICGNVTLYSSVNLESLNISGTVTLTSVFNDEDYSKKAELLLNSESGKNLELALTDSTIMENLHITATDATKSKLIYTGLNLVVKDTVITTGSKTLKLLCGRMSDTTGQDINVSVYGGEWCQIFAGSNSKYNSGNINLEVGGNISVTSNIAMGGNCSNTGNITFTMNGGYVKVLYDTPSSNGVSGNLTMNLNKGSITEMRDYNGKSGMVMGNIIVNLGGTFNCGSGQFGVWSSGSVTTGIKILNLFDYQGVDMNSLANYDVVNVFGGNILDNFEASNAGDSLNIYNYSGIIGLTLSSFNTITAYNSDITFLGAVPTSKDNKMALVANDGTVIRVRPGQNPGVEKEDFLITENGSGKVVLEEPDYVGNELVMEVDFDNKTASDKTSKGNDGVIAGDPEFVESYDGSYAIYFNNVFGKDNADEYVTFSDIKGLDISKDDFTIMFWYKTVNGGLSEWAKADLATPAGSNLNMNSVKTGGVVFSNQNTITDTAGFSAAQLCQDQYFTTGMTDGSSNHYDVGGIRKMVDDSWHMVTVTYDRDSDYCVYVDDTLAAVMDISNLENLVLGANTLTLGADIAGQYGLENAYIDDLKIYAGEMLHTDVQAHYYAARLKGLINSVENRVDELGTEYDVYKGAMSEKNNAVKAAAANLTVKDYTESIKLYNELWEAYGGFLSAPQSDAKLSALLLSDIHIAAAGDSSSKKLEEIFADLKANGIEPDIMVNSGDFADDSKPSSTQAAYDAFNDLAQKYDLDDMMMIASYGNHEIQYTDEKENYLTSTPVYWNNIIAHIEEFVKQGLTTVDSVNYTYDQDNNRYSYSYAVSYNGYHFLVLNGDYLLQTGNSKTYLDENGNYSIEGNEADPIRHGAYFYEDSLKWAGEVLDKYNQDQLPVFVINHYPFIDTVPLSYYDEIVINDNSIGKQDTEVRNLLSGYDNIFYFCGHLHSPLGMTEPVEVVAENGGSFIEINLPGLKSSSRAYENMAGWIMYVYENEIVLRARDYVTGEWLPQYDEILHLSAEEEQIPVKQSSIVIEEVGTVTEGTKDFVLNVSGGADGLTYQFISSNKNVLTVDENNNIGNDIIKNVPVEKDIADNGSGENVVNTGDNSASVLWIFAMIVSAAVYMLMKRRKTVGD